MELGMLKLKQNWTEELLSNTYRSWYAPVFISLMLHGGIICIICIFSYKQAVLHIPAAHMSYVMPNISVLSHVRSTGNLARLTNVIGPQASVQKMNKKNTDISAVNNISEREGKKATSLSTKSEQKHLLKKTSHVSSPLNKTVDCIKRIDSKKNTRKNSQKIPLKQTKNMLSKEIKKPIKDSPILPALSPLQVQPKKNQEIIASNALEKQQVIEIGVDEYAYMKQMEEVYEMITNCWRAPRDVIAQRACIASVSLNAQGLITTVVIEESSGTVAYDIAVRNGLYAMHFPRTVWGKKIVITFKHDE